MNYKERGVIFVLATLLCQKEKKRKSFMQLPGMNATCAVITMQTFQCRAFFEIAVCAAGSSLIYNHWKLAFMAKGSLIHSDSFLQLCIALFCYF